LKSSDLLDYSSQQQQPAVASKQQQQQQQPAVTAAAASQQQQPSAASSTAAIHLYRHVVCIKHPCRAIAEAAHVYCYTHGVG